MSIQSKTSTHDETSSPWRSYEMQSLSTYPRKLSRSKKWATFSKFKYLTAKESVRSPGHIRVSLQHLRKQRRLLRHEHREIEQSGFCSRADYTHSQPLFSAISTVEITILLAPRIRVNSQICQSPLWNNAVLFISRFSSTHSIMINATLLQIFMRNFVREIDCA